MNIFSSFGSQLFRGSVSTNSASYINKQNVNVLLDPSGTDYIDYSNNNNYFEDAHGINPNDENTTSLIMQKNDAPFYLSTLDDFTLCVKYKIHDDLSSNDILGQHFISPVYDVSLSTTNANAGDNITITVTKGSNESIQYIIQGDLTSENLGITDMSGILTEVESVLQYTIQSGSGNFIFTIDGTDVSGTVNVSKTYWVTIQTNVLGKKVFAFSETGPSGPFYNQKNISFTAGDLIRFDVSDPSNNDFVLDFGSTVDIESDDGVFLSPDAAVNIVSDGGNKYVFNNGSTYQSSYNLSTGTYTIRNVSSAHPIAVLNNGNTANITYSVLDESPIVIKVSGGSSSSPYYNFTDEYDNSIDIAGGVFRFMRGRTYQFVANGIIVDHPFKVHTDNGDTDEISGSSGSFNVAIPTTQSLTDGYLYYFCRAHPSQMKANMSVMNLSVTSTTADGTYDFYYGDVQINVLGDFGTVSVYCYYHGYMGGENMFTYSAVPDLSSYISRTGTPGQSNSTVTLNIPESYSGDAIHYFEDSSANMGLDQVYYNMTLPNKDLLYNGTTWTNTLGHSQFDISVNLSASEMKTGNNTIQKIFTNTAGSSGTESVVLGSSAYYTVNPVDYSGSTVTAASSQTISGEWIEWEFPYAVRLYSIQLNKDYESVSNAYKTLLSNTWPQLVSLVGSNDGIAWTFIEQVNTGVTASAYSAAGKASAVSNGYNVVEVNNSQYFTYYRMIVESIVNDGGVDISYASAMSPRIGEIHLGCDIYTVSGESIYVTVSGSPEVFHLNGVSRDPIAFTSGTTYYFDQSDTSNTGNTFVLGTVPDSSINLIDYQTIVGTPGQPGAYTSFTASGETVFYFSYETPDMGYEPPTYTVKTETNVLGDIVFSIKKPGDSVYYTQPDLSFGAGFVGQFDVAYIGSYSLVFGTEVDVSSTIQTQYFSQTGDVIVLSIPSDYSGDSLKYFEDTSAGMGYVSVSTGTRYTVDFGPMWALETEALLNTYMNTNHSLINATFYIPQRTNTQINGMDHGAYYVENGCVNFLTWKNGGTDAEQLSYFEFQSPYDGECQIYGGYAFSCSISVNGIDVFVYDYSNNVTSTLTVQQHDIIRVYEYAGAVTLYNIEFIPQHEIENVYTVTISGDTAVFYIDGSANPQLTFTSGTTYVFDLSHNSNAGNTLVLGTVPDSSTSLIDYQTIVGTPGQPGAYTSFTASGETVYYYSFETPDMGYKPPTYTVKTDTNVLGDTVFSIKKPGDNVFYTQPDLSFGAGTTAKFNVSIIEGSYTLVFGTTIDDPLTIISNYAVKTDGIIDLVIPSEYNGVPLRYFDISNANMGYVTHDIPIQSSFTSIATDSNVYGIKCSANGQYVFAKSGNNVLKSNDYGLTYSVTDTKVGGNYIVVSEDGKDVCVWNGTTFATSNDYGITFTKRISSIGITYISATGQHIVLFSLFTPFVSNDYGATSSSLTTMTGSKSYQDVQMSATGQYIMFSTNEENGVRVSDDYGATFSVKGSNCPYGRGLIMSDSGQYAMAPTDGAASHIYTTDYGDTWNVFTHGTDNTILPAVNSLSITQALNYDTNISLSDMIYYSYNGIYQYYSDKISSTTRHHYYSNDSGLNFSNSNDSRFDSSFMLCLDDYSNIYASVGSSITRSFTTIPPTIINVTVSNEVFLFDGTLSKPQMNFNNTHTYVFKQDDHTNTGNTLVLGYLPDYIDSSNYIPNQLIVGTAGQSGAFTRFTANTDIVYYFSNETPNMGYKPSDNYFVKVENNLLDEPVYSFKSPGSLIYTKQPIIPIIPNTHLLFDVSEVDDSYNLVFGTVVDDPTTIQTQYMKKIQNTIILSVPYSSTGSLKYFDSSYNNMGYKETLPIVSSTVHQTLIIPTNVTQAAHFIISRIFFNADCTIAFVYFSYHNGSWNNSISVYESDGINWNIQSVNSSINDSNYLNTIDIHGGNEFIVNGKGDKLFTFGQDGSYFTAQYYYDGTEWNRSSVNLSQYGSAYIYGGTSTASYYGSITFTNELTGWDLSGTFAHNSRHHHQNEYAMRTFGQYEGTIMNPFSNLEWWMITDMNHEGDVIVVSALVYKYNNDYSKEYGSLTERKWSPIGGLDGLLGDPSNSSGTHAVFGIGHNTVALSKGFTFNQSSEFYDPTIKLRVAFAAPGNDDYKTNAGTLRIYEYDELKTTIDTDPLSSDFGPKHWRRIGQDIHGDYAEEYYGYRMQFNRNGSMIIARTNNNEIKIYTYLDDINLWTHIKTITSDNLEGVFASGVGNYPAKPATGLQYRLHETDNKILIYETDVSNIVNTYDIGTADLAINIEVTVSNEVFMFHGSEKPNITFDENTMYIFDQSDPANAGNTLVLGTVPDSSTNIIDYQTVVGTPGHPGAYTSFTASSETVYYYSYQTDNMGA